jgi:hypothetical protein
MRKVFLKYGFIFEPVETWSTQSEFENDLASFFKGNGYCAEIVETAVGQENIPIIYLTKTNQQEAEAKIEFTKKDLNGEPTSKTRSE